MADRDLNLIVLPQGGSVLASRPPADPDGLEGCATCEDQRREQTRTALVEFRRALKMLDANAQALIAALDLEC